MMVEIPFLQIQIKIFGIKWQSIVFLIFSGMPYVDKIQLKCGMTCEASAESSAATSGNRNYLSMISKKIEIPGYWSF